MADDTATGGDAAARRATVFVAAVLCLLAISDAGYGVADGGPSEAPFVAALVVLPMLYVVPATRPWWLRHRWLLLAVQAALTYMPFALFGGSWPAGLSGWLAGLASFRGDPYSVHPVAPTKLGDRRGQVIAHGAIGQEQLRGDLGRTGAGREPPQHVGLTWRQRTARRLQRRHRHLRINHPLPASDPAQCADELIRRSVLDQEARHVRIERPAQEPGPPQHRQDHHPARRQPLMQLRRSGKAVNPRHVDIQHCDVGTFGHRRGYDALAGRDLGDHLDVLLQVQHRDQRVPQNPHVLRDQNPDHRLLRQASRPTAVNRFSYAQAHTDGDSRPADRLGAVTLIAQLSPHDQATDPAGHAERGTLVVAPAAEDSTWQRTFG